MSGYGSEETNVSKHAIAIDKMTEASYKDHARTNETCNCRHTTFPIMLLSKSSIVQQLSMVINMQSSYFAEQMAFIEKAIIRDRTSFPMYTLFQPSIIMIPFIQAPHPCRSGIAG